MAEKKEEKKGQETQQSSVESSIKTGNQITDKAIAAALEEINKEKDDRKKKRLRSSSALRHTSIVRLCFSSSSAVVRMTSRRRSFRLLSRFWRDYSASSVRSRMGSVFPPRRRSTQNCCSLLLSTRSRPRRWRRSSVRKLWNPTSSSTML